MPETASESMILLTVYAYCRLRFKFCLFLRLFTRLNYLASGFVLCFCVYLRGFRWIYLSVPVHLIASKDWLVSKISHYAWSGTLNTAGGSVTAQVSNGSKQDICVEHYTDSDVAIRRSGMALLSLPFVSYYRFNLYILICCRIVHKVCRPKLYLYNHFCTK